ncbi:adaptor protein MecA [Lactobacillus sp. Sy-1]|uniref:adaptor protein MecA n=1 Tax=Lactobacillus sp. Sy-1 TaxID=2109645 RepID=UPI001C584F0E|nr:adaptor protein MecA [Lactobacillus sp. Sy-1]MBW1605398.1 adaptor protein MecA [Lactobacillus sp. Sy-1]
MEMDRINDNTIRVLINNDDLSAHGITVLDLLGDHKQIEEFFYSILDEIDTDHQFQGDNEALTFQVLPNKNGLELFISKADPDDPEKTQQTNDTVTDYIKNQLKNKDIDVSDIPNIFENDDDESTGDNHNQGDSVVQGTNNTAYDDLIVEFNSFEDFISLSKRLRIESGSSNLYLYDGKYYLEIMFFRNLDGSTDDLIENNKALALEFGNKTSVTTEILNEYGKKIMDTSALELARYYFKD